MLNNTEHFKNKICKYCHTLCSFGSLCKKCNEELRESEEFKAENDKVEKRYNEVQIKRITSLNNDLALACFRLATLINRCHQLSTTYIDDSFPPCNTSLYTNPDKPFINGEIIWKRPIEIDPDAKWTVIEHSKPWDIIQGDLGDCWLISALSVISENKSFIHKVILTRDYCCNGIYIIRLCINGLWKTVTIDDYLPVDKNNNLIFSKANSNELYVSLIEKAVAKCFGCYEKIIKGHCIDGLSILTGAPCESIFLKQCKDIDEPWESIRQWRDKQFPMSCSCGNKRVSYNSFNNIGLHPYHAYSILDTEEIKNKRVFKLRNPWGTTNWKGKFSQRSSIWTKSLLENHDPEIEASKGIFRIPLEDFCRFFNSIDVAFTDPDLFEVRYRYTSEYAMFTLVVPNSAKSCDCNFSLYQKQQHDRCKHVDLLIYVGKADTLKQVTRSRRVVRESFTGCSQTLPAGEYIVICMSIIGASEYCTFVVHSRCRLLIRKQDKPITEQTIDRALVQMAIGSNSEVLKVPNCNGSVHQLATNMSGLLIVAVNNHKSLEMKVKCDCSKSENMISSRNSKFKINDIIPAKSIAVLIILTHKDTNKDYVVSSTVSVQT